MSIRFAIEDASTNGEAIAAVLVRNDVNDREIRRQIHLRNKAEVGELVDDVESDFGSEAAGDARKLLDEAVAENTESGESKLLPVPLRELMRAYPELREPVIDGLLRRGQVGNLVSTSKAYKTFLVLMLAVCMAMKRLWLDVFPTVGGRVLIIDLELQQPDIVKRLHEIIRALHAPPEILDSIDVLSFRGRDGTIDHIEGMLLAMETRTYSLVILDPLYKTYPAQFDENSNAQMTWLYRRFERIAEHLDGALLIVHHATKGSQSEKRTVDVGAGAGSQSRSADCHIALREHEVDGCVVCDAKVRSFRPPEPLVLRFEYPLWQRDIGLDPTALKSGRNGRNTDKPQPQPKEKPEPLSAKQFTEQFLTTQPQDKRIITARARQAGIKNRQVDDLVALALSEKLMFRWCYPKNKTVYFATIEQPVTETAVVVE